MGIYDRDYYRSSGPSLLGGFAERGTVCKYLICINIVVFVFQILDARGSFGAQNSLSSYFDLNTGVAYMESANLREEQVDRGDSRVSRTRVARHADQALPGVLQGQVWRLLSYAFLHDPSGLMHILFNMLFLWWFGSELEALYGPREFLAFYLSAAAFGGVLYTLTQILGFGGLANCIGASGAVTAVMVLSALHYPNQIILLFFFLPVPIWAIVGYQVIKDFYAAISGIQNGTAVWVHLGGAALALAYYQFGWRFMKLGSGWQQMKKRWSQPRLRVYREEPPEPVVVPTVAASPDVDEQLEAKLDAVLEKVSRYGQGSLTEQERLILVRASEIYKRRRT